MYKLSVSRTGINKRKRTGQLLHVIAGLLLLLYIGSYYRGVGPSALVYFVPAVVVAVASIGYGLFLKKWDNRFRWNAAVRLGQVLSFSSVAVLVDVFAPIVVVVNLYLMAAICLYLLFIERQLHRYNYLLVSKGGMVLPRLLGAKKLHWPQVKNVVLRPDYVTVFLYNEKFVQVELSSNYSDRQLKEIEGFCREQIASAIKIQHSHN